MLDLISIVEHESAIAARGPLPEVPGLAEVLGEVYHDADAAAAQELVRASEEALKQTGELLVLAKAEAERVVDDPKAFAKADTELRRLTTLQAKLQDRAAQAKSRLEEVEAGADARRLPFLKAQRRRASEAIAQVALDEAAVRSYLRDAAARNQAAGDAAQAVLPLAREIDRIQATLPPPPPSAELLEAREAVQAAKAARAALWEWSRGAGTLLEADQRKRDAMAKDPELDHAVQRAEAMVRELEGQQREAVAAD